MPSWAINSTKLSNYINLNKMEETSKNNETAQLGIGAVSVSLLAEFADYILHNANWSESYANKPWYSEIINNNVDSKELAELFLNSR